MSAIKIGDRVLVERRLDSTLPEEFVGRVGVVRDFDTNNACGNDEDHPLIEVSFERRVYYREDVNRLRYAYRYHFWTEELRRV